MSPCPPSPSTSAFQRPSLTSDFSSGETRGGGCGRESSVIGLTVRASCHQLSASCGSTSVYPVRHHSLWLELAPGGPVVLSDNVGKRIEGASGRLLPETPPDVRPGSLLLEPSSFLSHWGSVTLSSEALLPLVLESRGLPLILVASPEFGSKEGATSPRWFVIFYRTVNLLREKLNRRVLRSIRRKEGCY